MARSRQRLALNTDPGKTTQTIQQKIVDDLDVLIEQSRRQLANSRNQQPQQGKPQQAQNKPPQNAQANNSGPSQMNSASSPAKTDKGGKGNENAASFKELLESGKEWGQLSPRARDAIVDGGNESMIEPYSKLIYDYYKTLAAKQTERSP